MTTLIQNEIIPIDIITETLTPSSDTTSCKYKEKYSKLCKFSNVKFISIHQIIEMISLINSFAKRNIYLYENDLTFTVFNFYSKEALFLFKLVFEKKFNVSINRIYIKKIKFEMYKIHIFIFKQYSNNIKDAIKMVVQENETNQLTNFINQETWFILDLIISNLTENNKSSFKLTISKDEISFLYLNINLIYITTEYIKAKFNKEVSCVKKEMKTNECTYYFEIFADKTTQLIKNISDKIDLL
jgi:hypothetical protein